MGIRKCRSLGGGVRTLPLYSTVYIVLDHRGRVLSGPTGQGTLDYTGLCKTTRHLYHSDAVTVSLVISPFIWRSKFNM